MALTPKQAAFAREYLIDLNATQAAIRAGYSARTAKQTGAENLSKPVIAEAIKAAQQARAERVGVTADMVVNELARLAFSNMRDFVVWGADGVTLRPSSGLPPDASACVAEVSETTSEGGGSLRFKLHSKTAALELLGRHLGMFKDKLDVSLKGSVTVVGGIDLAAVIGAKPGLHANGR